MPLTALALVLAAAMLHAAWNIAAKKSGGGAHFVLMGSLMIVLLWAPLGGVLLIAGGPALWRAGQPAAQAGPPWPAWAGARPLAH